MEMNKKFAFLMIIILIPFIELISEVKNPNCNIKNRNISVCEQFKSNPKTTNSLTNWTFMVYLDADCNLESAGIEDINEMEIVGSDENISIVVQIDRISGYDSSNGDWTGAIRYNVTKDFDTDIISSPVKQDIGEVNMGAATTLQDFIQWAKSSFPAENYALILWDHGSGIMDGSAPGGVCWDDTNGDDYLTLPEIYSVLSTNHVDLLGFDACLMGSLEVHYQLQDCVDVIVGSEDVEPTDGYPYNDILSYLKSNPGANPEQLAEQIVISYNNSYTDNYEVTQAAFNALTLEFNSSLNNFVNELNRVGIEYIRTARSNSLEFFTHSYIDLFDFANELSGIMGSSALYLINNITAILIKEAHAPSQTDAHGLTIYFPRQLSLYSSNYENSKFAHDFNWDEFLVKYYTGGLPGEKDDNYEENDDFLEAKLLSPGQYEIFCNASDVDFFNVSVNAGQTFKVKILFDHDQGNLDLFLFNISQIEVNRSDSLTDNEYLSYNASYTGYYTIMISQNPPPSYLEYQPYTLILGGCNNIESSKINYINNGDDNDDNSTNTQINYYLITILSIMTVGTILVLFLIIKFLEYPIK